MKSDDLLLADIPIPGTPVLDRTDVIRHRHTGIGKSWRTTLLEDRLILFCNIPYRGLTGHNNRKPSGFTLFS